MNPSLTQTTLFFVVKALLSLVPDARIERTESLDVTFSLDFFSKEPLNAQMLSILEERARILSREDNLEIIEMVSGNASLLLESLGQKDLGKALIRMVGTQEIVALLRDERLALPIEVANSQNEPSRSFWKIFSLKKVAKTGLFRLEGAAFPTQSDLKTFVKNAPAFVDHAEAGEKEGLFSESFEPGAFVFKEKGLALLDHLKETAKNLFQEASIDWIRSPSITREKAPLGIPMSLALKRSLSKTEEGGLFSLSPLFQAILEAKRRTSERKNLHLPNPHLPIRLGGSFPFWPPDSSTIPATHGLLDTQDGQSVKGFFFLPENEILKEAISSLQLIQKIAKILSFECEWKLLTSDRKTSSSSKEKSVSVSEVFGHALDEEKLVYTVERNSFFHAPRIEARFRDNFGNRWPGSTLVYHSFKDGSLLLSSQDERSSKENPKEKNSKVFQTLTVLELSLFSSLERTLALSLEKGASWLSPFLAAAVSPQRVSSPSKK